MSVLMKCGCRANGKMDGKPCCAIHVGLHPGATEISEKQIDLSGRQAKCSCGQLRDSNIDLAFFEYRPERNTDIYYCGHAGWD